MRKWLALMLAVCMLFGQFAYAEDATTQTEEPYGELGYDDEISNYAHIEWVERGVIPSASGDRYDELIESDDMYIHESVAADGIVDVMNRSFAPVENRDEPQAALAEMARTASASARPESEVSSSEIANFEIVEDAKKGDATGSLCYRASWQTGANEDLREHRALIAILFETTLIYKIGVSADHFEEYEQQIQDVFDGLQIEFVLNPKSNEDLSMINDTLYGVISAEEIRTVDFGYEENTLDVSKIANALSAWTGLSFAIEYTYDDEKGGYIIDWLPESSLIAGPPDPQSEEFFFYDVDTLSWFMMNSLCKTIEMTMGDQAVYYTVSGEALDLPNINFSLPMDVPFQSCGDARVVS